MRYIITLLAPLAVTAYAADDVLSFDCVYTAADYCAIRFDMEDDKTYTVTQLGGNKSKSEHVFPGDRLKAARFYYLTACEENECNSSGLYWSPDIRPTVQDYPDTVEFNGGETGELTKESLESAAVTYNVFASAHQLRKLGKVAYMMQMVEPEPHVDGEPNFPHMENVIHHTLYYEFQKARNYALAEDNISDQK